MKRKAMIRAAALAATSFLALTGQSAFAQASAASEEGVSEIVVTAQKRSESVQDVPLSITALSGDSIDKQQIHTLEGLQSLVPNLYLGQALSGSTTPKMFLRGIGVDNQVFSFDSPIGIYIDGVYRARTTGALSDLYDVERVEFLRGPQGTLYGRNSSVGSLNVIHAAPPLEDLKFKGEVGIGSKDQRDIRASLGVPLVNGRVGAQISVLHQQNDGWMRNVSTGGRAQDEDITTVRGALLFKLSDNASLTLRGDVMIDKSIGAQASLYDPGVFGNDPDGNIYTFETSPGAEPRNKVRPWGVSATLNADLGGASLTSTTAYRELIYRNAGDVDGYAAVQSFEVDRQDLDETQFSQEVFLSGDHIGGTPIKWTTGLFYFHETNRLFWSLRIFAPPPTSNFHQVTDSEAVYGQFTYPVTDKFNITAGARYTWEKKKFDAVQLLPGGGGLDPNFNFNGTKSTHRANWHASLDYQIADSAMLYVTSGTGFRSGGFNGNALTLADITSGAFGPEKTFVTEGGIKSEWFDRRLRFNADYYYAKYTDMQQAVVDANGQITTSNAQATANGFEVEVTAIPFKGMELTGSLGTVDFNFKGSPFGQRDTAKVLARVGATYTIPLGEKWGSISIGGDVNYSSRYFFDPASPDTYVDPYFLGNAHITYRSPNDRWNLTLAGYNIGDTYFPNHAFHISPTGTPFDGVIAHVQFPNTPRRWLLTLGFKY